MTVAWIIAAATIGPAVVFGVGYEVGRVHAEFARRRFVQSLMPSASEHTDFDEFDRESPWGESQRGGYHCADMRRDRVRRHPEAPTTFPAGDVA